MSALTFLSTRKGKAIAIIVAALVALVTAGVLWETSPQRGGPAGQTFGRFDNLSAMGKQAIDALKDRSPGPRIGGIALKGKAKRERALPGRRFAKKPTPAPTEKALGKIFYPSEFAIDTVPAGIPPLPTLAYAGPDLGGTPGAPFVSTPPGGGLFLVPPGGGTPPGGGGGTPPGGGGGTPPGGGGGTPPGGPPPSAVPEPSAWLLMIFGFGIVGAAMRRKSALLAV